jgi:hypothetical protein
MVETWYYSLFKLCVYYTISFCNCKEQSLNRNAKRNATAF